tara:strand:- start:861 stop:1190 length:330 start_codon:yes stop_codon:yes gene_type:complete
MAEIIALDGVNWVEFFSSEMVVFILGRSDCSDCLQWYNELTDIDLSNEWVIGKMNHDQPGIELFKQSHTWIERVDVVPYNAVFVNNEMVDHWAGGDVLRLLSHVQGFSR